MPRSSQRSTRPSIPTEVVDYRLPGRRRGHGEDSIYWDEPRKRYIGAVDLGFSSTGTCIHKKVSGKTKVEVRDKLRELHKETDAGLRPRRFYTVSDALEDWHATDYVDGGELWVLRGVLSNPHWAATLTWSFDVRECGILTARWDSS